MSQVLINQYLAELDRIRKASGSLRESVVREAFKDLLKAWGRQQGLQFVSDYELDTKTRERRYVAGALLHALRVPFGYWEAKDEADDLDAEIAAKFKRGYPQGNILFDGKALLVEAAREVLRDEKLNRLYKPAMLRITAEYNVMTREYRNARLLEFVEHDNRLDEKDLARLTQRGAKAWRDVPDAGAWVDDLRGSEA